MASKRPPKEAPAAAPAASRPAELAYIRVDAIDPPERPLRTTVADVTLEQLAASIRQLGLIEPLVVSFDATTTRYRVIAGHRRLAAAQLAGLESVPVIVRTDLAAADAVMLAENVDRLDLAPADEAAFVARLYERLGDVDAVAAHLRRTRQYVDRYLELHDGHPTVTAELLAGRIGVGQALELNRAATEEILLHYLQFVVSSGATVRQTREWIQTANGRHDAEERARHAQHAAAGGAPGPEPSAPVGPSYLGVAKPYELPTGVDARQCRLCGEVRQESAMWRWYVCAPCGDEYVKQAIAQGKQV